MATSRPAWMDAPVVEGPVQGVGDLPMPALSAPPPPSPTQQLQQRPVWMDAPAVGEDAPGRVMGVWNTIKDLWTGESRTEFPDVPELGTSGEHVDPTSGESLRILAGYLTTPNTEAVRDIAIKQLRKIDPEASVSADRYGNPMITFKGQPYYVNKPGGSGADAMGAAGTAIAMAPVAKLTQGMRGVIGMGTRALGYGGTSVGQDVAAGLQGSEQGIDLPTAAVTAGMGAAEVALAPLVQRAWPTIRRMITPTDELVDARGNLTRAGRRAAEAAGLDPARMDRGFAQQFAQEIRKGLDPRYAASAADANSLPVKVPLSRGQVTGLPQDQMFESMAEKGAYGDASEGMINRLRDLQNDAIADNVGAIQSRLGGGRATISDPRVAGEAVQGALARGKAAAKAPVDAAYDAARATSAGVPGAEAQNSFLQLSARIAQEHDLQGLPRASSLLNGLQDLAKGGPNAAVRIRSLFDWRQRASNARQAGGEEAMAIGKAIRGVDEFLDQMVDQALVHGDDQAIDAFQKAIKGYRGYAGKWKGGDLIERLTTMEPRSGRMELAVAPDQAVSVIFGSQKLFGGMNTARDLAQMRKTLGAGSPEWRQLKEAAFLRLVQAGQGQVDPMRGGRAFSGVKFAGAIDDAFKNQLPVLKTIFDTQELGMIQKLKRVAAQVGGKVRGGDNHSNTAVAAAGMIQRLINSVVVSEGGLQRLMALPLIRTAVEVGMLGRTAGALREGAAAITGASGRPLLPIATPLAAPAAAGLVGADMERRP